MPAFSPSLLDLPFDLIIAAGVVGIFAVEWTARDRRRSAVPDSTKFDLVRATVWGFAVIAGAVALFFADAAVSPDIWEPRFVAVGLAMATLALAVGAGWKLRFAGIGRVGAPGWWVLFDLCLVLSWSLFVRFGLTEANILTDGGSGYVRLLHGPVRFSGLSVLVQAVMSSALQGLMFEAEDSSERSGGVEVFVRYRRIVEEAVRRHEVELDPLHVVGLQAFRRAAEHSSPLPQFGEVRMRFFEVARDAAAPACWYFYEGTYCAPGLPHFPTTKCRDFLAAEPHRTVATWPIEFWSHRPITRPLHRVPSLYDPQRVLALHQLTRQ